ncbi:fructosamine kinase PKL/CAK/FruK [Laetiporus sulphureus 93-53]|uniref:protein-ribulosamine 3-kinase n=1 Tax=Laetiporus sulphureus 93-53 TaxID=1314785 RepID=A0A165CAA3_9APHY|nr:fructosamine kinase PKL/CAK/FruK [Laetiporus sulphureus 93-53]KZT02459.1 fructosamine kinase PKL/CAK/FruK [Laetiporus sulphureus 93-53]
MVHPFSSVRRLVRQASMPPHVHRVFVQAIQKEEPGVTVTSSSFPPIQSSSGTGYIGKIGSTSEKEQYVGEAESLKAIHIAVPGLAPRLIVCGTLDEETAEADSEIGRPYFLSEYKDMGSLTDSAAKVLGKRLATEMHAYKSTNGFGFHVPTFCGATRQQNGWYDSWEECYDRLIGSLLDTLEKRGGYESLCKQGKEVRKRVIPALLGPLVIQPVLLHGDLWSGNTGTDRKTGQPVIFDPSSYFGHNEADLAIARIFGGIPHSFFNTYHEYLAKSEPQDQYDLRGDLYELYHYLNHTVLFGGSYASSAKRKMDRLLQAIP